MLFSTVVGASCAGRPFLGLPVPCGGRWAAGALGFRAPVGLSLGGRCCFQAALLPGPGLSRAVGVGSPAFPCGAGQLLLSLPKRFDEGYSGEKGFGLRAKKRPLLVELEAL